LKIEKRGYNLGEFVLTEPYVHKRRFSSKVIPPRHYKKYIKKPDFFVEYDEDFCTDESILNIPLTATILPLAWLTGADVRVGKLDKTFKHSMDKLQNTYRKMYPHINFDTNIIAEELIPKTIGKVDPDNRTGLMFSGGVDSTYSMIKNLDKRPRLMMLWGVDNFPYPEHPKHWGLVSSIYRRYAEDHGLSFNLIKTNISQLTDDKRIEHDYSKQLNNRWYGTAISHSFSRITPTAPLSFGRFDRIIFASTYASNYNFKDRPQATMPEVDEKIVWADLSVKHDGALTRPEKIEEISRHHQQDKLRIRVCLRSSEKAAEEYGLMNDCSCEKCYRTMISLMVAGTDPNTSGFKLDKTTFQEMRKFLMHMNMPGYGIFWTNIAKSLQEKKDIKIEGAQEFFDWLETYNPEMKDHLFYRELYNKLPYIIANKLPMIYRVLGIKPRGIRL
jgi:hypothetical protein